MVKRHLKKQRIASFLLSLFIEDRSLYPILDRIAWEGLDIEPGRFWWLYSREEYGSELGEMISRAFHYADYDLRRAIFDQAESMIIEEFPRSETVIDAESLILAAESGARGVLHRYARRRYEQAAAAGEDTYTKMVVYIDMDGVLCDYEGSKSEWRRSNPDTLRPQYEDGFFYGLAPVPGAVASFERILDSWFFDPYILTSPAENSPKCYSEKRQWVERHLGRKAVNRLIISPHKNLLCGDFLIDDHREGKGQDRFAGEFVHFGSEKFPDWPSVLFYLHEFQQEYWPLIEF